jgi:hypothetical protein
VATCLWPTTFKIPSVSQGILGDIPEGIPWDILGRTPGGTLGVSWVYSMVPYNRSAIISIVPPRA